MLQRERATASEPRERSAPAKRRTRERVGEFEGRSPSIRKRARPEITKGGTCDFPVLLRDGLAIRWVFGGSRSATHRCVMVMKLWIPPIESEREEERLGELSRSIRKSVQTRATPISVGLS